MRLIHTFTDKEQGKRLLSHLAQREIKSHLEGSEESSDVSLWVTEEDRVEEAEALLEDFLADPENAKFDTVEGVAPPIEEIIEPSQEIKVEPPRRRSGGRTGVITLSVLFICIVLYFFNALYAVQGRSSQSDTTLPQALRSDPLKAKLLFDYPAYLHIRDILIDKYGATWMTNPNDLPPQGKLLLLKYQSSRVWEGLYSLILHHHHEEMAGRESDWSDHGPLFERYYKGEVWRFVTPAFLHGGLFHIFFNLAWLLTLGTQMESRLGAWRYLLFIFATALFSNTCQYLMSGYNFLGLSGVVCAMLGFIWQRQKSSAWEGYLLQKGTVAFISIFVLGLAGLQTMSFFSEFVGMAEGAGAVGVANTAHIMGGVIGIALGRSNLFSWHR